MIADGKGDSMIFLIFAIAALDLLVKALVEQKMPLGKKRQCYFKKNCFYKKIYIWHIKNKGVAYNRLEGKQKEILIFTGGCMTFFAWLLKKEWQSYGYTLSEFALAFILGGALGNFLERINKGYVTDYIYIEAKKAPVFNIADVFIVLGTVVFCLSSLFHKEKF